MKILIIILCIANTLSAFAGTFQTDDDFSITLPDDWIQIPKQILDDYSEELFALSPKIPKQIFDYGFQHTSQDTWLYPPYIAIQVKNVGRMPSGELSQFKKFEETRKRVSSRIKKSFNDTISDVSLDEPIYDAENNILYIFSSTDLVDGGTIRTVSGIKLTERGLIQLLGYAPEENYEIYKQFYLDTFAHLDIEESIKYKPQITDSIPILNGTDWEEVLIKGIEGAIILGIISVATILSKKKKRKEKKPQPEEPTPDQF